ncbi:MAG: kelch repeat-containing protein [Thermoplasmata archaeon]|nr:kelch repeat-containing protein [Thermoplasmata archaeon]
MALGVTIVLLAGMFGGPLSGPRRAAFVGIAQAGNLISSLGLDTLRSAEDSLFSGGGPAHGGSLNCTLSSLTLSGQCGTLLPVSNGSSPSIVKHKPPALAWQPGNQPEARTLMSITFDARDSFVLAFGGWNGTTYFGDTWEYLHGKWMVLNPSISPSPRAAASMVFDKKDGFVLLFGGRDASGVLGDTWTFAGDSWTRLTLSTLPSPRSDATMAWDVSDGYAILFGGSDGVKTLSDAWKFVAGNWTLLLPVPGATRGPSALPSSSGNSPRPPPGPPIPIGRQDASITFDYVDNIVVMFGGLNVSGGRGLYLNDTWEFSVGKWTTLTTPHSPPARSQGVFAFDSQDNDSVLFGGVNSSVPTEFRDTWTLARGVWSHPATNGTPSSRQGAAGTWDVADQNLVLFSGEEQGLPASVPDTWNYVRGQWTLDLHTSEFSWSNPAARYAATMAYDTSDNVSILFGGATGFGANGETWNFTHQQWTELFPPSSPPARSFATMVFDGRDQFVVLFGGRSTDGSALGDTWTFHANVWTHLSPTASPPARYGAGMAFDAADGYVVLYGGVGASGTDLGDTWTFAAGSWSPLSPGSTPGPRGFTQTTYDGRDGYTVLYGGLRGATLLGDTWKFLAGSWTNITGATVNPPPRWGSVFLFDPANNIVLLFAGCEQAIDPTFMECDHLVNDSWRLNGGNWGQLTRVPAPLPMAEAEASFYAFPGQAILVLQSGFVNLSGQLLTNERWVYAGSYGQWFPPYSPTSRAGGAATYDARNSVILLFGGYGPLSGGALGYLNDTWGWDSGVWTQAPDPKYSPSARAFGSIAWDTVAGQVVYFGGYGPTGYLNDTWAWLGSPVTGSWHLINTTTAPSPRANATMVFDAVDGHVILFGGQYGSTVYGDTWAYYGYHNRTGTSNIFEGHWVLTHPPASPPARTAASMVYDSSDGYTLLFGGHGAGTTTAFNETWIYKAGNWTKLTTTLAPAARFGAAMGDDPFDAARTVSANNKSAVVLFGGETTSGAYLGDTWTFYAGAWTLRPNSGTPPPFPGAFEAIGSDILDGNPEMFGGTNGYPMGGFWTFS